MSMSMMAAASRRMMALSCLAVLVAVGSVEGKSGLFIFGDSYADTGNSPKKTESAWQLPYGETYPGYPTGRYSDGVVQSDVLGSLLGIPSPVPYTAVGNATRRRGINFAWGGAGATYAYGRPTLATQVGWFESVVKSGRYSKSYLERSVIFVSIAGNDYAAYNGSIQDATRLPARVVKLIGDSLKTLYCLGVRNIMVSAVSPFTCTPVHTWSNNYTKCVENSTMQGIIRENNVLLIRTMRKLSHELHGVNFIYLNLTKTLTHIQDYPDKYGLSEAFRPCCEGNCSRTLPRGLPAYRLCEDAPKHLWWDLVHPTQAGWRAAIDMYWSQNGYTEFARNIKEWRYGRKESRTPAILPRG